MWEVILEIIYFQINRHRFSGKLKIKLEVILYHNTVMTIITTRNWWNFRCYLQSKMWTKLLMPYTAWHRTSSIHTRTHITPTHAYYRRTEPVSRAATSTSDLASVSMSPSDDITRIQGYNNQIIEFHVTWYGAVNVGIWQRISVMREPNCRKTVMVTMVYSERRINTFAHIYHIVNTKDNI